MDDGAYKRLFSRPRMVRDLLSGFAARDWSAELDLASLTPLSASYVTPDLRQRHNDLVWRLRFRDERWLYVVLLLEFQSAVDRSMAVRMLTYTALLYQKLIADGVLRERSVLPPVLPVVIYNGRRPWTPGRRVAGSPGVRGCKRSAKVRRERRRSSAGANPARQLPLQPVAVGADEGGNDIG